MALDGENAEAGQGDEKDEEEGVPEVERRSTRRIDGQVEGREGLVGRDGVACELARLHHLVQLPLVRVGEALDVDAARPVRAVHELELGRVLGRADGDREVLHVGGEVLQVERLPELATNPTSLDNHAAFVAARLGLAHLVQHRLAAPHRLVQVSQVGPYLALVLANRVLIVPHVLLELAYAVEHVELRIPVQRAVVLGARAEVQVDPGGLDERLGDKALVHGRYVAHLEHHGAHFDHIVGARIDGLARLVTVQVRASTEAVGDGRELAMIGGDLDVDGARLVRLS